jgi:lactate dehydrogenase-like 2-hydroxyacid dehydrogenase
MTSSLAPILILSPRLAGLERRFSRDFEVVRLWENTDPASLAASGALRARAGVAAGGWGIVDDAVLERLPNLGLITCFGAGYDNIDLPACKARGVAVTHCPAVNDRDVADLAIWLILDCVRKLSSAQDHLRSGVWEREGRTPALPGRLGGRTVGIYGLGSIGRAIARRAEAFDCPVLWSGPRPKSDATWPYLPNLASLAEASDILVLACPGGEATRGIVDAEILARLGSDGVLINIARGSVVDEDALIESLRSGTIAAAGLDVFAAEPTPAERWKDVPNVSLTPHIGGGVREAVLEQADMVLDNLRRFHAGEALAHRLV